MQTISEKKVDQWLLEHEASSMLEKKALAIYPYLLRYDGPSDAGKKTAMAREIAALFKSEKNGLLLFREVGVWPSSMNVNLYDGYRRSMGITNSMVEFPGYIFAGDDLKEIECLMDIGLYFFWDVFVIGSSSKIAFLSDHHDNCVVQTSQKKLLEEIKVTISRFKFPINEVIAE